MQKLILIARLTKDIEELRYTKDNKAVTTMSVATNEKETTFLDIVVFGTQAENCKKYLSKGSLIAVECVVKNNNYEKDGKKVYGYKFIANSVQFLDTKKEQSKELTSEEDIYNLVGKSDSEIVANTFQSKIEIDESSLPF